MTKACQADTSQEGNSLVEGSTLEKGRQRVPDISSMAGWQCLALGQRGEERSGMGGLHW